MPAFSKSAITAASADVKTVKSTGALVYCWTGPEAAAAKAAHILRGKHKPTYTPHVDTGDFVVIVNADKIRVTGNKGTDKRYYRHSGFPGGLKSETFNEAIERHPERVLEHAIKGMLPKNTLGRAMGKKLKVYAGPEHPHQAQNPRKIELKG